MLAMVSVLAMASVPAKVTIKCFLAIILTRKCSSYGNSTALHSGFSEHLWV